MSEASKNGEGTVIDAQWLDRALSGEITLPGDGSATLLEKLIAAYDSAGPVEASHFDLAIENVLSSANARKISSCTYYHLLQLTAHAKPRGGLLLLKKTLLSGELRVGLPDGKSLEELCANASAEYGVFPWYEDFLLRRCAESDNPRMLLVALQQLPLGATPRLDIPFLRLVQEPLTEIEELIPFALFVSYRRAGLRVWTEALLRDDVLRVLLSADSEWPQKLFSHAESTARRLSTDRYYFPFLVLINRIRNQSMTALLKAAAEHSPEAIQSSASILNRIAQVSGEKPAIVRMTNSLFYHDYVGGSEKAVLVVRGAGSDDVESIQINPSLLEELPIRLPGFDNESVIREQLESIIDVAVRQSAESARR